MAVTALLTSLLHYCHQRILYQYRQFFTHSVCVSSAVAELQCMRQICYFFYMLCRRRLQADVDATWLGERIPEVTCPRTPLGDGAVPRSPAHFVPRGGGVILGPYEDRRLSAVQENNKVVRLGRVPEKKRQDSQKKSRRCYILLTLREAPRWTDLHRNLHSRLVDVIACAKFSTEIFRGYVFTWGSISDSPIDSCMGLTTVGLQR